MTQLFANNQPNTLNGAINDTVTSITLNDSSGMPEPTGADYFLLTIANLAAGTYEVVNVTDNTANVLTVVRGHEGTAQSWTDGELCQMNVTKDTLVQLQASGTDTDAIHLSTGSEISTLTTVTVASGDLIVIEDISDSNNKKKILASDLLGAGTDNDAIHDNVASEISALTTVTAASGDLILIEDVSDSNNKKKVLASDFLGAAGLPVVDTTSIVEGSADATKEIRIEVDGLSTSTIRVWTAPDRDVTLGGATDEQLSCSNLVFPATQVASGNANTLDDYEEGSWTPVIYGSGTAGSPSYTTQYGRYQKVGGIVFFKGYVVLSSLGGMTGTTELSGLPFTSSSDSNSFTNLNVGFGSGLNITAGTKVDGYINIGATTCRFTAWDIAGGVSGLTITEITASFGVVIAGHYEV